MKIVFFFAMIVATVLVSFVVFYVKTHGTMEIAKKLHVFILSQNDDDFSLTVNATEFSPNQAEEGDMGTYSYVGRVPKHHDSAFVAFKSQNIDTTFKMDVKNTDSIAVGAQNDGSLFVKKF